MKVISIFILFLYLIMSFQAITYAQTVLSGNIVCPDALSGMLSPDKRGGCSGLPGVTLLPDNVHHCFQDMPELQGYDWERVKEDIQREKAVLRTI